MAEVELVPLVDEGLDPDQDPLEIAWRAAKIGYDTVIGELDGGPEDWVAATAGELIVGT